MHFWESVENELKFLDMTKKELAIRTGINLQSLHKAFERKSEVSAINAVKIAQALNVSVEYLVTGKNLTAHEDALQLTDEEIHNYKKLHELIKACNKLSQKKIQLLKQIAENFEKEQ